VRVVAPLGVEKTHPPTETTSFTARPRKESGVRFVKVVAEVVSTVRLKGAKTGIPPGVRGGGMKKNGKALRVKLDALEPIAATEPVI
jgi:hypothetical protein